MKLKLIIILIVLAATNNAFAQEDTVIGSLTRDIPIWMAQNNVPCTGVGFIEGGKIKWVMVFGVVQEGHPAPENTLFNIASQTKPITAMLVLKLVQAGLWKLDEPLADFWIDPDIAGSPFLNKLTTRMVLSHQTGFPNWRSDNGGAKLRFNFEPGTRFGYSGEGFEYLRRALEKKFQIPLDSLMKAYLFKPADMQETQYWSARLDTSRFAKWHDGKGKRYNISMQTSVSAADDLITTVKDYCKFGIYTMNGMGLPDTLFADMVKPQVKVKENYYRCLGWGLVKGLSVSGYALEHGGSDIGVRTMAVFLPKSKSGVVVMTNADNGMFVTDHVIARAIAEGAEILHIMNQGSAVHTRITIADDVIKGCTGLYTQSNGKLMKVEQEGNAIRVSGDGLPTAVLYPESANKFFLDGYDVQLEFIDKDTVAIYENGKQVMKLNRKQP